MTRIDYCQPDFFRFSSDSLELAKYVIQSYHNQKNLRFLEVGVGSGVISCELSNHFSDSIFTLVEAQEIWKEYLEVNINLFFKSIIKPMIYWQTFSDFSKNQNEKFDLIYFNPPYFELGSGKLPASQETLRCRFLILDSWTQWIVHSKKLLKSDGNLIFTQKTWNEQNDKIIHQLGFKLLKVIQNEGFVLIVAHHLDVERSPN